MPPSPDPTRPRHTRLDDAQGIVAGVATAGLGLMFLQQAGLVTGQTAGLALILAYATGWPLSLCFAGLSAPFWLLALRRMGPLFVAKTAVAVALLAVLLTFGPGLVTVAPTHPLVAAGLGGLLAGFGLLALFRHGASFGGVGVLAFWLQDAFGFRAGWTQMLVDLAVFALAFLVLDPVQVAQSAFGALVLNLFIALNHDRQRYVAI